MYILQNQDGYFLSKSRLWSDGRNLTQLYRTHHRDEAANELFEVNSQDFNLRLRIVDCETNAKGLPIIPDELLPPPLPQEHENETEQAPDFTGDTSKSEALAC